MANMRAVLGNGARFMPQLLQLRRTSFVTSDLTSGMHKQNVLSAWHLKCKTVTEGGDVVNDALDMCCRFGMKLWSNLDRLPLE